MEKILIIVETASSYYQCIDVDLSQCPPPNKSYAYNGESALKTYQKNKVTLQGSCPHQVEVWDQANGIKKNVYPKKVIINTQTTVA